MTPKKTSTKVLVVTLIVIAILVAWARAAGASSSDVVEERCWTWFRGDETAHGTWSENGLFFNLAPFDPVAFAPYTRYTSITVTSLAGGQVFLFPGEGRGAGQYSSPDPIIVVISVRICKDMWVPPVDIPPVDTSIVAPPTTIVEPPTTVVEPPTTVVTEPPTTPVIIVPTPVVGPPPVPPPPLPPPEVPVVTTFTPQPILPATGVDTEAMALVATFAAFFAILIILLSMPVEHKWVEHPVALIQWPQPEGWGPPNLFVYKKWPQPESWGLPQVFATA